jgi:hypothetical protein
MIAPRESARKIPDPPGYETQRRILAGLSEAQKRWQQETGARLEVLPGPPYFRYSRDHLPRPVRTGETVSERPVRDESGRVVARIVSRLLPDGEIIEKAYPIAGTPSRRGA